MRRLSRRQRAAEAAEAAEPARKCERPNSLPCWGRVTSTVQHDLCAAHANGGWKHPPLPDEMNMVAIRMAARQRRHINLIALTGFSF